MIAQRMAPGLARSQAAITGPQCKPLQRAAASVSQALTDGGGVLAEAETGASLIAVLAPRPRLLTRARQILAADSARRMRFYDSHCITHLR